MLPKPHSVPFSSYIVFVIRCKVIFISIKALYRPLWLLVGTPSAFGPELAYRLRVEQPTLMDVPIFFIDFYRTIYVCVPHFYDLSALVVCWSSVSIRRIIYKFLNVCPFDYSAVVISGKVERS